MDIRQLYLTKADKFATCVPPKGCKFSHCLSGYVFYLIRFFCSLVSIVNSDVTYCLISPPSWHIKCS